MNLATFLFIAIASFASIGLFNVKYRVSGIEAQLKQVQRSIVEHREAIKVLNAEWSHVTEPKRLQALSEKFLSLGLVRRDQVVSIGEAIEAVKYEQTKNDPGNPVLIQQEGPDA